MDALDVAAYLLTQAGPMDAMKLQKLVYYSQAWSLALRSRPLFAQEIQAWAYGPVTYELFKHHRGHFVVASVPGRPELVQNDPVACGLVDGVWSHYGRMTGVELSDLTHGEQPWIRAREQAPAGSASQSVISHESMKSFYSRYQPPFVWPSSR